MQNTTVTNFTEAKFTEAKETYWAQAEELNNGKIYNEKAFPIKHLNLHFTCKIT